MSRTGTLRDDSLPCGGLLTEAGHLFGGRLEGRDLANGPHDVVLVISMCNLIAHGKFQG